MGEEMKGFSINEEAHNVKVSYNLTSTNCTLDVFYKDKLLYHKDIGKEENKVQESLSGFSTDQKVKFFKDLATDTAAFINEKIDLNQYCATELILKSLWSIPTISNYDLSDQAIPPQQAGLLKELIEAGRIKFDRGKYKLLNSVPNFIKWGIEQNYIDEKKGEADTITPDFMYEYLDTECALETLKRYFRDAKDPKIKK
jgi:hypothetical protein